MTGTSFSLLYVCTDRLPTFGDVGIAFRDTFRSHCQCQWSPRTAEHQVGQDRGSRGVRKENILSASFASPNSGEIAFENMCTMVSLLAFWFEA